MNIILIILSIVGGIFAFCLPALRGYNLKHISGRIYSFEKIKPYKDTFEGLKIQSLVMMCYEMKKDPYSEEGLNLIISMYNLNSGALKKSKSDILEMLKNVRYMNILHCSALKKLKIDNQKSLQIFRR